MKSQQLPCGLWQFLQRQQRRPGPVSAAAAAAAATRANFSSSSHSSGQGQPSSSGSSSGCNGLVSAVLLPTVAGNSLATRVATAQCIRALKEPEMQVIKPFGQLLRVRACLFLSCLCILGWTAGLAMMAHCLTIGSGPSWCWLELPPGPAECLQRSPTPGGFPKGHRPIMPFSFECSAASSWNFMESPSRWLVLGWPCYSFACLTL